MPLASTNTARSTQRDDPDELDAPFIWGSKSEYDACSQIFTVRSNEDEASMVPNSGCAQPTLVIAASWAYAR